MEGLARIVAESMARHGIDSSVDHRRIQWSCWFRCESSFNMVLVPENPGLFALGEEMVAPGELAVAGGKRMLAIFQISETEDLGMALSRLFAPGNPLRQRIDGGRVFARYATIEDAAQRHAACEAFQRWLATSADFASGVAGDFVRPAAQAASPPGKADSAVIPFPLREEERTAPEPLPSGF